MKKYRYAMLGILAALPLNLLLITAAAASPLAIPQCVAPPVIDGDLADAAWSNALVLDGFDSVALGNPETDKGAHTAYILADTEWLYVGVNVLHPDPQNIKPVATRHGERIQGEDCVKFTFAPGETGKDYFHFRLSAGNVRAEMCPGRAGWRIPWRSATRITAAGWQAELAVPLAPIAGWPVLNKARLNVMVVTLLREAAAENAPAGAMRRVMTSWDERQGTGSFLPARVFDFGGLRWKKTFLPCMEDCRIAEYRLADSGLQCMVAVKTREYGGVAGGMQLAVRRDDAEQAADSLDFDAGAQGIGTILVPVSGADDTRFTMALRHPVTGEFWQECPVDARADARQALLSAYSAYNYYTDEENATMVCQVRMPAPALSAMQLAVLDADGACLAREKMVRPETDLLVPLARLAVGRQTVCVELRDAGDKPLAAQTVELVRRPPKPGHAVKVDQRRRVALVDGRPFFPFGFWYMGGPAGLSELGRTAFNTVHRGGDGVLEKMIAFMDDAHGNRLRVIPAMESLGTRHESNQASLICHTKVQMIYSAQRGDSTYAERSRAFQEVFDRDLPVMLAGIEALKEHPALLAWYTFDEPANKNQFALYRQGRELTRRVHELDGYHPVYMMGMAGVQAGPEDTDWCDIMGHDPYWVPAQREKSQIDYVTALTRRLRALGDAERKPVWMILVAERIAASYKRYVNAREQRCQTYLALIAGARGIFYYHWPIRFQANWEVFCQLAREIEALTPALLGDEVAQNIIRENDGNQTSPDLPVALFRYPDGRHVLLAANYQNYPMDVRFHLAGMDANTTVSGLFNGVPYAQRDGGFGDRLEPWGTRAYVLDGLAPGPVTVRLVLRGYPAAAENETPALLIGAARPGMKNLKPNSGFEEATNPGWPDYYDPPWFRDPSERIGLPDCPYQLDTENPAHGQVSLRIESRESYGLRFLFRHPGPLVLSMYMRAACDGVKAQVWPGGGRSASFTLTTEWQRYNMPLADGISGQVDIRFDPESVVWVDAVQIEAGTEMTRYEP